MRHFTSESKTFIIGITRPNNRYRFALKDTQIALIKKDWRLLLLLKPFRQRLWISVIQHGQKMDIFRSKLFSKSDLLGQSLTRRFKFVNLFFFKLAYGAPFLRCGSKKGL